MKKRTILAAVLALALLVCAGGGRAYAYFTTYSDARGGEILRLDDRTEIHENFGDWTKELTITSEENSIPMYVRAKAFGPEGYPLIYSGEGWTEGDDGWWYCSEILYGGGSIPVLNVKISGVPESEYLEDGDKFNVVVVYECAPVVYDENGMPSQELSWVAELNGAKGGGD